MTDFKNSMDCINPSEEVKNQIFQNIMAKAKEEKEEPVLRVVPKKPKMFINIAIAAAFVFGAFGIFATTQNNYRPTPVLAKNMSIEYMNEKITVNADVFYVENEEIKSKLVEDLPEDPISVWGKLTSLNIYSTEIILDDYSYEDNCLTLKFSADVEKIMNENLEQAIKKTYISIYSDVDEVKINY